MEGFNIGDWILPVFLIGGAIVQWLSSRNKEEPGGTDSFGGPSHEKGRPEERSGREWDDLLEALGRPGQGGAPGQAGTPPPAIPTREEIHRRQTGRATPPPVPKPAPAMPAESRRMLDAWQGRQARAEPVHAEFQHTNIGAIGPEIGQQDDIAASSPYGKPGMRSVRDRRANRFKSFLADRDSIRKSIVVNEVLSPPVSMR